jgi:hypothetical protein
MKDTVFGVVTPCLESFEKGRRFGGTLIFFLSFQERKQHDAGSKPGQVLPKRRAVSELRCLVSLKIVLLFV